VSATPMRTPARTPNRNLSRERGTIIPMTAEKEKAPVDDRDHMLMISNRILQQLAGSDNFNELVQKGFKSMTHKNFIMILQYFLIPIIGDVPKDFATSHVEFVYNLLQELEYPYSINKSSLKTPNAPHCLNSIILLLGWLADFSATEADVIKYKVSGEFPNEHLMNDFMDKTSVAFALYNDFKDTTHIEKVIAESYLKLREGTSADINAEIESLNCEIKNIEKETQPLSLLKELNVKKEESEGLEKKIAEISKNIKELNRKITNSNAELGMKRQQIHNYEVEFKSIQRQLNNQKMSLNDRRELLIEISQLKSALQSKRNAVIELNEASSENEIALSNLISKKFQLIDSLNNLLYKLSSNLNVAGIVESKFDPEQFELKVTKNENEMNKMLNNIHHALAALKEKYNHFYVSYKDATTKINGEYQKLTCESEIIDAKVQQLRTQLNALTTDEASLELELQSLIKNSQTHNLNLKDDIENIKQDIVERTAGIQDITFGIQELLDKKTALSERAVSECQKLYTERKTEVDERRIYLSNAMTKLKQYEERKKPLPENLQNLLDRVMCEHEDKENMNS
jgi:kinetochore protein NDC80